MCVNAGPRQDCLNKINSLNLELVNENKMLENLNKAKGELQNLVNEAQCAIDNLGNCDFGGTKILDSVTTSQQGYQDRMNYYDDYIIKCSAAIKGIEQDLTAAHNLLASLPVPCGVCIECCPPEDNTNGGSGSGTTGR